MRWVVTVFLVLLAVNAGADFNLIDDRRERQQEVEEAIASVTSVEVDLEVIPAELESPRGAESVPKSSSRSPRPPNRATPGPPPIRVLAQPACVVESGPSSARGNTRLQRRQILQ
jgi:hypothetical protein